MRHFKNCIAPIILSTCLCSSLFAQSDSLLVHQIRNYVKYIDSINSLNYVQDKGFVKSIAEGVIKRDNKVVGGYGIYSLSNLKNDTVFRIEYHDNFGINTYKTYYYQNNKIVYATLEFKNTDEQETTFFRKEEFYNDDKVILKSPEQNPKRYIDISSFSMLDDGKKLLADFQKK